MNRVLWYIKPGALGEPGGLEIEPGALVYTTRRFGTKTGWFGNRVVWVSLFDSSIFVSKHIFV